MFVLYRQVSDFATGLYVSVIAHHSQCVEMVLSGRIPVSEHEAVFLAGCKLQVEFGDYNSAEDYIKR